MKTSATPEYRAWHAMKDRCTNPRCAVWDRYGGRGITVCDRWLQSFSAFLADVGPRPESNMSIDRIDNNGNYEPGNVRWATQLQQQTNSSQARLLTLDGETLTISGWARRLGISRPALRQRLRLHSIQEALSMTRGIQSARA